MYIYIYIFICLFIYLYVDREQNSGGRPSKRNPIESPSPHAQNLVKALKPCKALAKPKTLGFRVQGLGFRV